MSPVAIFLLLLSRSRTVPVGGQHVFAPQAGGLLKHRLVGVITEGQLDDARPVPQVHKDQAAQVPLPLNPAADRHRLTDMFRAQRARSSGCAENQS